MPEPRKAKGMIDFLREQIISGQIPPGGRVPPLRSLMTQFTLSFNTVKRGIDYLEEIGLVETRAQSGVYVNYPDIRLLLQSLMNKYSAASGNLEMFDEETLKQLTECVSVPAYQLRSARFPLEGVKIPSFLGRMTLQVRGSGTMARYIRLLARFGEYSGAGIKTGMGMGALRMQEGFGEKEKA